jgi:hypothetical protein
MGLSGYCRSGELLLEGSHGGRNFAPHALLRQLWLARRGSVAGDGANPQRKDPAVAGAATRAGGVGRHRRIAETDVAARLSRRQRLIGLSRVA